MDLHYDPLDLRERVMKAEWEYATAIEELVVLRAEVERLREDKQRLEAEKRVMLFPSIKKWHERADAAEAEVERLTMDVEGTHRENERLREERDSSASNWGKERELRAENERLRVEVRQLQSEEDLYWRPEVERLREENKALQERVEYLVREYT